VKKWIQARLTAIKHRWHTIRYVAKLNSTILFGALGFFSFVTNMPFWHFIVFLILFLVVDFVAFSNGVLAERDWHIKNPS
jgi:preprotein translocase subunit SecG